jgi:excisionase family DNA binding protein
MSAVQKLAPVPARSVDSGAVYTIPEAAAICRVGVRTYYAAAARGEVPATRIGRRLVVSGYALERLLTDTSRT